ncbi:MAG TPA: hypothetical protein PK867_27355 [Pirellulales bacterium]|nr:hypothetical protein [Pirellulales bacterium]
MTRTDYYTAERRATDWPDPEGEIWPGWCRLLIVAPELRPLEAFARKAGPLRDGSQRFREISRYLCHEIERIADERCLDTDCPLPECNHERDLAHHVILCGLLGQEP